MDGSSGSQKNCVAWHLEVRFTFRSNSLFIPSEISAGEGWRNIATRGDTCVICSLSRESSAGFGEGGEKVFEWKVPVDSSAFLFFFPCQLKVIWDLMRGKVLNANHTENHLKLFTFFAPLRVEHDPLLLFMASALVWFTCRWISHPIIHSKATIIVSFSSTRALDGYVAIISRDEHCTDRGVGRGRKHARGLEIHFSCCEILPSSINV